MKRTIGWREWITLPTLGIERIKAKVDTGARTSALHAFSVEEYEEGGRPMVRFGVHPSQRDGAEEVWCTAPVADRRVVRDSGGHEELRFVIEAEALLGDRTERIEVTLTDRDNMGFRMLLGRTALRGNYLVDPARSYLLKKAAKAAKAAAAKEADE